MIDAQDLVGAFARNLMVVKMQVEGLSHADSLIRVPEGSNCLNWALGHIAVSRDDVLALLGAPPASPAGGDRYRRGAEPLAADGSDALPLSDLVAWIERAQGQIAAALGALDAAALAATVTMGDRTFTIGQRLFFLYFHESYHVGQTELYRQLAGRHDPII
jgi:DinB superfamily